MTNRTQLVAGEIVDGTVLTAWLVKPDSGPEAVMIKWPDEPTSVSPRHYGDLVARVTRLLANSSIELAAIKAASRRNHDHPAELNGNLVAWRTRLGVPNGEPMPSQMGVAS